MGNFVGEKNVSCAYRYLWHVVTYVAYESLAQSLILNEAISRSQKFYKNGMDMERRFQGNVKEMVYCWGVGLLPHSEII